MKFCEFLNIKFGDINLFLAPNKAGQRGENYKIMKSAILLLNLARSQTEQEGLRELVSKLITFKYSNDVENGRRYALTLRELLSYGCYCQFDDEINYRHRHGIPGRAI